MKGTIISPESEFYSVKDIDAFVKGLSEDNITLKDFIENQQFALDIHDTLEKLVKDGRVIKLGDGTDEDKYFEELRVTLSYLKKKQASFHKEKTEG
jgi:hypothetical protein